MAPSEGRADDVMSAQRQLLEARLANVRIAMDNDASLAEVKQLLDELAASVSDDQSGAGGADSLTRDEVPAGAAGDLLSQDHPDYDAYLDDPDDDATDTLTGSSDGGPEREEEKD